VFAVVCVLGACAPDAGTVAPQTSLPGAAPLSRLQWLAGTFRTPDGEVTTEEMWTEPGGGTMFGVSRSFSGDRLVAYEWLHIEARGDAVVYIAHPSGRMPGTEFTLRTGDPEGTCVFENPDHDFPTRVVYERIDATRVRARAENDERALVFDFERAR
jgi:hypothetical protein